MAHFPVHCSNILQEIHCPLPRFVRGCGTPKRSTYHFSLQCGSVPKQTIAPCPSQCHNVLNDAHCPLPGAVQQIPTTPYPLQCSSIVKEAHCPLPLEVR